jgi:hypothetical protein
MTGFEQHRCRFRLVTGERYACVYCNVLMERGRFMYPWKTPA